jgi:hypothetical chaperone protein
MSDYCAIDFGTSNSVVGLCLDGRNLLAELEPGRTAIPTAVFYGAEDNSRSFGRAAIHSYIDGLDGRLMRSLKSILGSDLLEAATELGPGISTSYVEVVTGFLRYLKATVEKRYGVSLARVVLGRPVFFVDDDPVRDRKAQNTLEDAARAAGFDRVTFQYEPIAAALSYEATCEHTQLVLVADIGGGTSDFSVIRIGPEHRQKFDRHDDILAKHGIHIAGTDFDQRVSLRTIMPTLGLGSQGVGGRVVPSATYFDLSTWHRVNAVYAANNVIALRHLAPMYADKRFHKRLMTVVDQRLGHRLLSEAERAKIEVTGHGIAGIELDVVEGGLAAELTEATLAEALEGKVSSIVEAARKTVQLAGLRAADVDVVYFTGGSTGLGYLASQIAGLFPDAAPVFGDKFGSVAAGLTIEARRLFSEEPA